ncbi:aurora kinase A- and ninein-interacting protein [Narcine bancroftii]|uniref:aurora kinase A- and ninein-interacting protein n=1 Tax=Narcine bancroftii TaxID=1343680 RepID=UPI003831E42F
MKRRRKYENQKVEECGIWIDTKELKRKRTQAHSISELLNPLSRSKYNIAVALNLTQTKAPQKRVKQTTVSSFFLPKSKGNPGNPPHESRLQAVGTASPFRSTTEEEIYASQPELSVVANPCGDRLDCSTLLGGSEVCPTALREACLGMVENNQQINKASGSVERTSWALHHTQQSCHKAATSRVTGELQSGTTGETGASTKGPILFPDDSTKLDFTYDSQGNRVISHSESAEPTDENSLPNQGARPCADSETMGTESFRTELLDSATQHTTSRAQGLWERKTLLSPKKRNSAPFLDDKENIFKPFMGKRKHWNQSSGKKHRLPLGTTSVLHCPSVCHDKPMAFIRRQGSPSEQCELSLLFSQDSQGKRVISHRSTEPRSRAAPSNVHSAVIGNIGPPHARLPYLDLALCNSPPPLELEDDIISSPLFTQDSEGQVVIKHSSRAIN